MKVNLNRKPCTANFAAKPPPLPSKIKAARVETATRKFDPKEWEDFFMQYWNRTDAIPEHYFRDMQPNTSIGLRTADDVVQLKQNGRRY